MGYRSDVKAVITGTHDEIVVLLATWRMKCGEAGIAEGWKEIRDDLFLTDHDAQTYLFFHGENWKWYPDYAEVRAFQTLWDLAEEIFNDPESNTSLTGSFIRIGEDDDDIKTYYFGDGYCDALSLSRSSSFEFDTGYAKSIDEYTDRTPADQSEAVLHPLQG